MSGQNIKRYTATLSICSACYPNASKKRKNENDTQQPPHNPKCAQNKCSICDMYGHDASQWCHQQNPEGFRPRIIEKISNNPKKPKAAHNNDD